MSYGMLSMIFLCYRITCLWFCNKRFYNKKGHYLCQTLYNNINYMYITRYIILPNSYRYISIDIHIYRYDWGLCSWKWTLYSDISKLKLNNNPSSSSWLSFSNAPQSHNIFMISLIPTIHICLLLKNCIYFLERGEGKEKERERIIDVQEKHPLFASHMPPTGEPLVCRLMLSPLSHISQGTSAFNRFGISSPIKVKKT